MGLLNRARPSPDAATSGRLLRELLYGDVPLAAWRSGSTDPVSLRFQAADAACARGMGDQAVTVLTELASDPAVESRDRLEAWAGLRDLGVVPDRETAAQVLGVVLDVPRQGGVDTLAGYADGSARFVDHTGAVTVLEPGAGDLHDLVIELVQAAARLATLTGPPVGRRPARVASAARASILCPGGLVIRHAEPWVLVTDPVTAPVFAAGAALVEAMATAG